MQNLKENWQKLSEKTRKLVIGLTAGMLVIVVAAVILLNLTKNTDYSTLFTGMNQEEAQEVAGLLNESGVDYRYDAQSGTIKVPQSQENQLRVDLLSKGYPKSGFTYDMRRENTGIMTTESDKEQYTLYELQDRLGATIRLFEGVTDAKVTISPGTTQRYAIEDTSAAEASASVVITMNGESELSEKKASAVKNLVARSVQGMTFTNVSVFDANTMLEVGAGSSDTDVGTSQNRTALESMIENNIATNIRRVLGRLYGQENVAVSVKGTLNVERVLQEYTQYKVPEKFDEDDKTGLLQREDLQGEQSLIGSQGNGGIVGTDANADTPRYTNDDDDDGDNNGYSDGSASREWLYDVLKEQKQVDPGYLENLTVGVVIDTDDTRVSENDLIDLIANSAGIFQEDADQKVSIIRVPINGADGTAESGDSSTDEPDEPGEGMNWLPIIIAGAVALAVLLLLVLFLLLRRGKRKHKAEGLEDMTEDDLPVSVLSNENDDFPVRPGESVAGGAGMDDFDDGFADEEANFNMSMRRGMKLKENVNEFVERNPQIAAKLLQSWLKENDE